MKKSLAFFLILATAFLMLSSSCQPKNLESSTQLRAVLAKYTAQKPLYFQTVSINKNHSAAFAIVQGQQPYNGDVWYVTASGAKKLQSSINFPGNYKPDKPNVWNVKNTIVFKCESDAGGSSSSSFAWYIKNGSPVELPYVGMALTYIGGGNFETTGNAYDCNYTNGLGTGHSYKIYYLYWTGKGLKEYGGLKITRQQLLKVKGAKAILNVITASGLSVDAIYYRSNNIINVNFHSGNKINGSYDNLTLKYANKTVTAIPLSSKKEKLTRNNWNQFSYGGIYAAALFPKIAVYPKKFW